ncbi:MAG TPA: DNA primase [Sulfurovum sp. UBA12169]|nr:MAG TPA: DNA primase [Sulfurovum sp. UBA12169]
MPITNESKEALKSSVDIVDVISDYIELKKNGANFKACCPFHGEKTPSFVVSPSKQIYHCFGCGAGGDVFKFVQEMDKLEFTEAVEKIASRFNFTLHYTDDNGARKDYDRTMETMTRYYAQQLREEDMRYLSGRGMHAKTMREWELGYAPSTKKQMHDLGAMMLPPDELLELGITVEKQGRISAKFWDRLMFPIRDHRGKAVGYSGRTLQPGGVPKYMNSPQTPLFDKSRILFGYDKAKEHIYAKKFVIIMEGQLDVILSRQCGIQTAVATQGTALTEHHLPLLSKPNAKVILAYDGDKAGRAAAFKAAVMLSTKGFDGGVVLFPEGEDAASMVAAGKEEVLKQLLKNRTDFVRFCLQSYASGYDLGEPHGKSQALKACVAYLKSIKNDIIAQEYVGFLSSLLGIDRVHIRMDGSAAPPASVSSAKASAEDLLLYTMYMRPGMVDAAVDVADDEVWSNQTCYRALLSGVRDEAVYAPVTMKEGLAVLDDKQFYAVLRVKQKSYLQTLKARLQANGAGIDEILAVNERMKGL